MKKRSVQIVLNHLNLFNNMYNDRPVKCPYCEQIFSGVTGHLCNSVYHLNPFINKETLPSEEDPQADEKMLEDALLKHCKHKKQSPPVAVLWKILNRRTHTKRILVIFVMFIWLCYRLMCGG